MLLNGMPLKRLFNSKPHHLSPTHMITNTKSRRIYQATTKTGVVDTFSTIREGRAYDWAVVIEKKALLEKKTVDVPMTRWIPCKESYNGMREIPHICQRTVTTYKDEADGKGEAVLSFHTTEAHAIKAMNARIGQDVFNAYVIRTTRIK